jgi:D-xylose reductase
VIITITRILYHLGLTFKIYTVPIPLKYVDFDTNYPPEWYVPDATALTYERSPIHETWAEMEKLVDSGLVRNIGIANFNVQLILDMLTYCKYKPSVLQGI